MNSTDFIKLKLKKDIIDAISDDQNVAIPIDIRQKLDSGVISIRDLENAGIPDDIIPHIFSYSEPNLLSIQDKTPDKIIESDILEFYFWGLASSGKTCALASILHTIQSGGIAGVGFESADNSYNDAYLQSLKDEIIKSNGIAYFPNLTPSGIIKYMSFKLIQQIEKKNKKFWSNEIITLKEIQKRKIAFIDLSGELIRIIVDNDVNKVNTHIDDIKTLKNLLNNGRNRKIHFFFIDYDRDNDSLNQIAYLERMIKILNKEKSFVKTEFIYIVITKSDMFRKNGNIIPTNQRRDFAKTLFNDKYHNLYLNLLAVCTDHQNGCINGDKNLQVELDNYILDFSMGDVYFKRICKFNPDSAREIIKILIHKVNTTDEIYE